MSAAFQYICMYEVVFLKHRACDFVCTLRSLEMFDLKGYKSSLYAVEYT